MGFDTIEINLLDDFNDLNDFNNSYGVHKYYDI